MNEFRDKRAVALVSGGLDSVVSLARAVALMEVRLVVFVNYDHRALESERNAVMGVADYYGLPIREIDASWLGALGPEAMRRVDAPPADLADAPALDTLDAVWIPNRNGVFLNIAAAVAEAYDCAYVVTGFNREEAAEFPDNSADYVLRANRAFEMSTRNSLRVISFTQELDKPQIVRLGVELRAPLSVIWSCYHSRDRMCGRCESCRRLKRALADVGVDERPRLEFEQ